MCEIQQTLLTIVSILHVQFLPASQLSVHLLILQSLVLFYLLSTEEAYNFKYTFPIKVLYVYHTSNVKPTKIIVKDYHPFVEET